MKKILFITDTLKPPYDEGFKKTVYNLYKELNNLYNIKVICREGFKDDNIWVVSTNALFISSKIFFLIRKYKPDTIIYLPFSSATIASYVRLFIFKLYAFRAKHIFFILQPKFIHKMYIGLAKFCVHKSYCLTSSIIQYEIWKKHNVHSELIPLITNLSKFNPLTSEEEKYRLRNKYNLPINKKIILHAGHINEGRNLQTLISIQKKGYQVLIIESTSTPIDSLGPQSLRTDLINNGILIMNEYIDSMREIYQLADLYVFPVINNLGSIGLPLSILEARACGLKVLTSDFGSIKYFLNTDNGNIFYHDPNYFSDIIDHVLTLGTNSLCTGVRKLNDRFINVLKDIID